MRLPPIKTIAWVTALFVICVGWGAALDSVMNQPGPWLDQFLVGVGIGGTVFAVTGLGATIARVLTKNTSTAFLAWLCLLLLAVMAVSIGATFTVRRAAEERQALSSPNISTLTTDPVARVDVDELLAEFESNEFAAAEKYAGGKDCFGRSTLYDGCRRVEVVGVVEDFGRDTTRQAFVRLKTTRPFSSVHAYFLAGDVAALASLRRQELVALRCVVSYEQGLTLSRCRLP